MAKQKMCVCVCVFFFVGGCKKMAVYTVCLMLPTEKKALRIEPGVLGNASYAIRAVGVA